MLNSVSLVCEDLEESFIVDDDWMSPAERALFESALGLRPALAELEAVCQRERHVAAVSVERLLALGLARILQPRRYGGLQSSTLLLGRVVEELAMACTSTAWVLSVYGEHALMIASFPQQAQDDVWSDNPLAVAASSLAPRAVAEKVDGGYLVTGTYPFASGCQHADWVIVGAMVEGALHYLLVPQREVEILDDWQTLGLRGTGSNTISLSKVFVPAHRGLAESTLRDGSSPGAQLHADYALLRAPRAAVAVFTQLPVTLGIGRRALRHTATTMRGRVSRGATTLSDSQVVQLKIGEASADINAAITLARQRHRFVVERIQRGEPITQENIRACRRDSVWAARTARHGVETLVSVSSAEIVHDRNILQLLYRDSLTAGTHFAASWEAGMVPFGKMLLGQI